MKQNNTLGLILITAVLIVGFFLVKNQPQNVNGSVQRSSEYHSYMVTRAGFATNSTVTIATGVAGEDLDASHKCLGGCGASGTLGNVTITGTSNGTIEFFDATTSDIGKRTGNTATTTILLASIPTNAATGTYTFDVTYTKGLIMTVGNTAPTSTVSWRE